MSNNRVCSQKNSRITRIFILSSLSYFLFSSSSHAEFALNFNGPVSSPTSDQFQCVSTCAYGGTNKLYEGGSFLTERLTDPNGSQVWHTFVEDPANGFTQESYIYTDSSVGRVLYQGGASSTSGGNLGNGTVYVNLNSRVCTDPAGCLAQPNGSSVPAGSAYWVGSNGNPLRDFINMTGNGTGAPNSVIFRQQLISTARGEWIQESEKPLYANKPKFIETQINGDYASSFTLDMTALDYLTDTTPAEMFYTLNFLPGVGTTAGDFNYATDKNESAVTGGMYSWTKGAGAYSTTGGADGVYLYHSDKEQGFDPKGYNYKRIYDPAQNTLYSWTGNWRGGTATAYELVDGTWILTSNPGSNADCNASNMTCPGYHGWQ